MDSYATHTWLPGTATDSFSCYICKRQQTEITDITDSRSIFFWRNVHAWPARCESMRQDKTASSCAYWLKQEDLPTYELQPTEKLQGKHTQLVKHCQRFLYCLALNLSDDPCQRLIARLAFMKPVLLAMSSPPYDGAFLHPAGGAPAGAGLHNCILFCCSIYIVLLFH